MSLSPRQDRFERNLIINGNFDFWQRGTSFVSPSSFTYQADRFQYTKVGLMAYTISRSTDVPDSNSNYSLYMDCTAADASVATSDRLQMIYKVEGYDILPLVGKSAVLSFKVKSSKTGTNCISFRNSGNDRSYVVEYTIDVADTWETKTIPVTLDYSGGTWDYTTGVGLEINFTLMAGTDFHTTAGVWQTGNFLSTSNQINNCDNTANDFRIAQVMFNEGEVAGSFSRAGRTIQDELALCQRYCEKGHAINGGFADSTSLLVSGQNYFATSKRAIPTITSASVSNMSWSQATIFDSPLTFNLVLNSDINGFSIRTNNPNSRGAGSSGTMSFDWIVDAEL